MVMPKTSGSGMSTDANPEMNTAGLGGTLGFSNGFVAHAPGIDTGKGFGYNPGYDSNGQQRNEAQGAQQRTGPQMENGYYDNQYQGDRGLGMQSRGGQNDYIQMLSDRANGRTQDSAAQMQLRQGTDEAIRQQMAMSHSGNPNQAGLAAYGAAQQGAHMQQQAVQQSGMLRFQEQQAAQQQLGQALQTQRQQDLMAAGMSAEQARAQAGYDLARQGQNDQYQLGQYGSLQNIGGQRQQGQEYYANLASGNQNAANSINAGVAGQNAEGNKAALGAVTSAAGSMLGAVGSDIRNKTDIAPAGDDAKMMRAIGKGLGSFGDQLDRTVTYQPSVQPSQTSPQAGANMALAAQNAGLTPAPTSPATSVPSASPIQASVVPSQTTPMAGQNMATAQANAVPASQMPSLASFGTPQKDPLMMGNAEYGSYLNSLTSDMRMKGGVESAGGPLAARTKQPAPRQTEADQFLSTLRPYSYEYTDPAKEPTDSPNGGRYLGVMAQNVEQGPTGNTIVKNTPTGKVLEGGALMSAMAAGVGRLDERMRQLEAARGKKV